MDIPAKSDQENKAARHVVAIQILKKAMVLLAGRISFGKLITTMPKTSCREAGAGVRMGLA